MSLIPLGMSVLAADVLDLISPAFIRPRSIGGFVADLTVREVGTDEMRVTDNPVEVGADVTDHAYMMQRHVVIEAGWSASSLQALGDVDYPQNIYQAFLALQRSAEPFEVVTGKSSYSSMLALRVTQVTDERSENSLMLTVECREVILVSTQTVSVPNSGNMDSPQANGTTQNLGTQSATAPATFSDRWGALSQ